jgi:predicted dinucleotide-binding enzyme
MRVGIMGAGETGLGLGLRWADAGPSVLFSYTRDRQRLQARLASSSARADID